MWNILFGQTADGQKPSNLLAKPWLCWLVKKQTLIQLALGNCLKTGLVWKYLCIVSSFRYRANLFRYQDWCMLLNYGCETFMLRNWENGNFAIIKRGLRSFVVPQMKFVRLPLSNFGTPARIFFEYFIAKFNYFFIRDIFLFPFCPWLNKRYLLSFLVHGLHGQNERERE